MSAHEPLPDNPHPPAQEPNGPLAHVQLPHLVSAAVISRFFVRLAILAAFAALGTHGYGRTLESLLELAAFYCAIVAPLRREQPFGPVLTHFDEAVAYALCACLVHWVS
jgi:hypothetical protein